MQKDESLWIPIYEKDGEVAIKIEKDESVAVQFNADSPFDSICARCPSYSNNYGTLGFSIRKWDETYNKTLETEVLFYKEFINFVDNTWLEFKFDSLDRGEYLLEIKGIDENVGVWSSDTQNEKFRTYLNGIEISRVFTAKIHFTRRQKSYFNMISENKWQLYKSAALPEEIVPDCNHPIKKLNVRPDTWVATDDLGRIVPGYKDVGEKKNVYVGMFYWTWHSPYSSDIIPRNLTEIINKYPEAQNDWDHPVWQVDKALYFWDESIYGYYTGTDQYVYRKHGELLADAGVDVVFFDCTNGISLKRPQYMALCKAWTEARNNGVNTPKIAFLMNFHNSLESRNCTISELEIIYQDLYRRGLYQDLWFYWKGKPLVMARYDDLDKENRLHKEILDFFTFRPGNPSYYSKPDAKDNWGWLSVYPQTLYGVDENGKPEQITVGVSQNADDIGLTAMNGKGVYGRSYTKGEYSYTYSDIVVDKNIDNPKLYGLNFQQQWDYAIKNEPEFIFVTGWNERTVGRYKNWCRTDNAFPDQFNDEYSRDTEPTKCELKDNYYYQLAANIRRFKGVSKPDRISAQKTIHLDLGIEQWKDIKPEFTHYTGNTPERNETGINKDMLYENHTMRNDIVKSKVAYDDKNIYFIVITTKELTPYTDNAWMRLFIDTGTNVSWETFGYVINRINPTDSVCYLEKSKGGWNWETVGELEYSVKENILQIKVPRKLLGKETEQANVPRFNFKWSDNMQNDGDIMDFYLNGDAAPGGRFKFCFGIM